MGVASHNDVSRLFPGIEDHAAADLLAMRPSIAELEAVLQMLQDYDDALEEIRRQKGDRLNRLYVILEQAQVRADDDRNQ
jgi:hypothetical protein